MKFHITLVNRLFCLVTLIGAILTLQSMATALANDGLLNGGFQEPPHQENFSIDNSHTSVVFAVSHFGLSYTYGRFNECSGNFALDAGELTTKGFSFKINAESIDTNDDARDKHLRGPDFFDTQQFPEITFVTTGFKKVDGIYQITGDITMRGQTQPLTMPVRLVGIGNGPFGVKRAGFFTKFTIKRSDFGMDKMAGQIGDNISITFSFEGTKQKLPETAGSGD